MLGRKAGCEGVRTDFSADLAVSRHRDIGPARIKPVDCEEALLHSSSAITDGESEAITGWRRAVEGAFDVGRR